MKWARTVFNAAGIYGFLAIVPEYFTEDRVGRDLPPPITHPEYYYGFLGVTLAWQALFLILARDPIRYRVMILPAVIEKASFGLTTAVLFFEHRISAVVLCFGIIDWVFAALFLVAYGKTAAPEQPTPGNSVSSTRFL